MKESSRPTSLSAAATSQRSTTMSNHKLLALFVLAALPTLFWCQTPSADIINVTAGSDTHITSNEATTNFSGAATLRTRGLSTITRATFVQFTLPADTKLVVNEVVLTLAGASTITVDALVEVLATTTAIDFATVTWTSALGGLITGPTGRDTDYTVLWNPAVWANTGQLWNINGMTTNNTVTYTDATAADGLLKFINDNYNGTSAVTFTIGLGLAPDVTASGADFRSLESAAQYAKPSLQLTFTAIPEPVSFGLLLVGLLPMSTRRRRR